MTRQGIVFVILSSLLVQTFCFFEDAEEQLEKVKLKINQGELEGLKLETEQKKTYFSFKTIPYAKPPVGELRFKRPQPAEKWEGVRDATGEPDGCPQYLSVLGVQMGDEDCLFINVNTPEINGSREVLFFVHGGNYNLGSSSTLFHGPGKIMDYDVVFVSFNYRLGALGFLSTDDEVSPGNFGLWDQVEALKWVHENIRSFGGNPDKITLVGYGTSLLLLQPEIKGMFNRVISQSVAPECALSQQNNPKEIARKLAILTGCDITTNSSREIVTCLKTKDSDQIIDATKIMAVDAIYPILFAPTVDAKVTKTPFFKNHPSLLLDTGEFAKVPVMTGFVREEGSWFFLKIQSLFGNVLDKTFIRQNMEGILANATRYRGKSLEKIANRTFELYFEDLDWSNRSIVQDAFVDMLSDVVFRSCQKKFVDALTKYDVPTYAYLFEYEGSFSLTQLMFKGQRAGIAHGDETQYMFDMPLVRFLPPTPNDTLTTRRILRLWTDFAKKGIPNSAPDDLVPVKWEPTERNASRFLHIGSQVWSDSGPENRYVEFWNRVVPQLDKDWCSNQAFRST